MTNSIKLTKRQQEILDFIQSHIESAGSPPTRAEIAKVMGFRSPNAAEDHLRALARKGVIELVAGTSRGIRVLKNTGGIPVVKMDRVVVHQPILSEQHIIAHAKLDRHFFQPEIDFIVQATDDFYSAFQIVSGDYLAIHQSTTPRVGQLMLIRANQKLQIERYNPKETVQPFVIEGLVIGVIRTLNQSSLS